MLEIPKIAKCIVWLLVLCQNFCHGGQLRIYPMNLHNFADSQLKWPIGQVLELTCELTNADLSQYSLDWYLPHSQGRLTNISLTNGRSTLTISDFNVSDIGPYRCKAQPKNDDLPLIKSSQIDLFALPQTGAGTDVCNPGFFQCKSNPRHCISNRYLCDGYQDCIEDGSDETTELCGDIDWCSGKIRCGNEARCMDPALCCDPEWDRNCEILTECCKPYIQNRRLYIQMGIEQSEKRNNASNGHIFVIVGCSVAFTCVLLVVIILMCQFPIEKPWLRPPTFLTRRPRPPNQGMVPVTMEDLDAYFESLRSVSRANQVPMQIHNQPPPYSPGLPRVDPPPPYPEDDIEFAENNNEDNNNGDINGNSEIRDQHVFRLSPVVQPRGPHIRGLRGGVSLVGLDRPPPMFHQASIIRGSRSYAAISNPRYVIDSSSSSDEE